MDSIKFDGQQVPVVGTAIADDKTYVFEFSGTLCWYPGEPWNGYPTTTFGDSGMPYVETVKAFEQLAQDDWKKRDDESDIICSRRDFEAVCAWGKIDL